MSAKKILITGAGGFIGSHLTEELVRQGHHVRAFVRYNSRGDLGLLGVLNPEILSEIEVIRADLKDPDAVRKAVDNCQWIFHLGALIAIPFSYTNPMDFVQTNVCGTAHVLSACLASSSFERLVHTSTSEVYGTAQYIPMDEKHPLQAQSPYAASKIGADKLVESFWRSFSLPVSTIRPFNTFGPRQSARAVIPTIVIQLLENLPLKLGSLKPKRDFTYVTDTVAAFIAIMSKQNTIGKTLNVGNGETISIKNLVEEAELIIGNKARIKVDRKRIRPQKSEVFCLQANTAQIKQLVGWKPRISLKQGLEYTVEWIQKNKSCYKASVYNV
jgi:NAD dependent epimerase/dehydratase